MKNAIILHGAPEKENYYDRKFPSESNAHWLSWLQRELIIRDIHAVTPEIPHSYEPKWDIWCREVERYDFTPETILVGHSAGAGFWLKYLSLHADLRAGKVILVAPWMDPDDTLDEKNFFDFKPDKTVAKRTDGITIFYAPDDSKSVHRSLAWIRKNIPQINYREFPASYGHFTYHNLGTEKFPELLEEIVS